MSDYTHAPTWFDLEYPENDRVARWCGIRIGRIQYRSDGPDNGSWHVAPHWYPPNINETTTSREAALKLLKDSHQLAMARGKLDYYGG